MAPVTTTAVLLRSHEYGDTSRVLRFYTEDHGLVSAMAKGVRGRTGRGHLAIGTFATGTVSLYLKNHRDLQTMKDFSCSRIRDGLGRDVLRFWGASAIAELVLIHADQERRPEPTATLSGIWQITRVLGFEPQLKTCIRCDLDFVEDEVGRFDFPAGGIACLECSENIEGPRIGPVARLQIMQLVQSRIDDVIDYPKKHLAVLSQFLSYHVVSRPLKSLEFIQQLLPEDVEPQ